MARRALAEFIARAREKKGLTQPQLADLVKVDRQQVYKWEHARAIPSARKLPALAGALDLDLDELYALHSDAKDEDLAAARRDTAAANEERDAALAEMRQIVADNRDINKQIGIDIVAIKDLFTHLHEVLAKLVEAVVREPPSDD